MRPAHLIFAALTCSCLLAIGCGDSGPALGTVHGKVTMDGQPLPNALVTFVPSGGGGSSTGKTDAQGNYQLGFYDKQGAVIGKHKVSVTTIQEVTGEAPADIPSDDPNYEKMAAGNDYDNAASFKEKIPAKYNEETTLEKEVSSGDNEINLELTSS